MGRVARQVCAALHAAVEVAGVCRCRHLPHITPCHINLMIWQRFSLKHTSGHAVWDMELCE